METTDTHRILVVDDERDIRDGCDRILSRSGHTVVTASRGEEALEILERESFSVVLLDLKMPGLDGMKVLNLIKQFWPDILVIVITGYATIETAIEAMKRGAYDFIPKPFKPDQLRIVVGRAIERKRLTEEKERLSQERERTLQDLDTEKSRTRTIIHALPDGVVVTRTDGVVALMNPAFMKMLCLDNDARPGAPIKAYVKDEGLASLVMKASTGQLPAGHSSLSHEFPLENGKYALAHATPVLSETGECLGAVTVLVDITELKMLDRLKSEFVSHVSHELRSPLSTINQQLAMILSNLVGDVPDEQRHVLSRAKEKTQALITLIGDLLDLSRIESGLVLKEIQPVDIAQVLKGVVDFLSSKAKGKEQTLSLSLPDSGLPPVVADPIALESVFNNLVTNAINYTDVGGRIEVSAGLDGEYVRVAVKDNGFGIEERHLKRIFERFYRVKDDKTRHISGTGLGLSIVKGILEALGGKVSVESAPGKGSTFTVFLPAGAPRPEKTTAGSSAVPSDPQ